MLDSHPSRHHIELFLHNQLTPAEVSDVMGHLLTDCHVCREITGEHFGQILQGLRAARSETAVARVAESAVPSDSPYKKAFGRALDLAMSEARTVELGRARALQLFDELLQHPQNRRLTLVKNSRRFQIPELCEVLTEKGFEQRFTDARLGVELTALATTVGQHLATEDLELKETRDLLGRAWAYHGNALRVASDLRLADQAFLEAKRCFEEGSGDDLNRALLHRFTALLLRARRRFTEAEKRQDHAIRLYSRRGETRIAAQIMGDQALGMAYAGDAERAVPRFEQALAVFDDLGEHRDAAAVRHNLAYCLTEMGQHDNALDQVGVIRSALQETGDYLSLVRLRWLEGKVFLALGRDAQAEEALVETLEVFVEESIGYDTALVGLDLAAVYAQQGRTAEVRELAEKILPIFRSRDVHREAIAAMILFQEAAQAETATLALIESVGQYLRQARNNPKLRFELPDF